MLWRSTGRIFRRALLLLPIIFIWLWAGVFFIPRNTQARTSNLIVQPTLDNAIGETDRQKMQLEITPEPEPVEPPSRPWFMVDGNRRPGPEDRTNKLFPGDIPNSDRIIEQLMYTLEDVMAPTKKILLANGAGAWNVMTGTSQFDNCPVRECELVSDKRFGLEADAVLFKDHFVELKHRRPHKQVWIMYYLECPYHTPTYNTDQFNWTATYRRDSDIVAPYERWVPYHPAVPKSEINYALNKTKKVAWFVSNCHARNNRLEYAKLLSKYISVDIYGACGELRCPRNDPYCLEMLDKEYKFYLAFENSNCIDYITEKFFVNGLGHKVIPIAMGARYSDYVNVAPENSFIHVDEFESPEQLADFLLQLDRDDEFYNSYFKWKGTGEFINTYFWCRLCAMVHAADTRDIKRQYNDLGVWWRDGACTKQGWRSRESGQNDYDP